MSKVILPILAAAAVGAGVFGFVQMNAAADWHARFDAETAKSAAAEKAAASMKAELSRALDGLTAANDRIAQLKRERDEALEKSKSAAPAGTTPPADAQPKGDLRSFAAGMLKSLDDPQVRKMWKDGGAKQVAAAYEKLFAKLNLSEDEQKLVAELINDRNFIALDKGRKLLDLKNGDDAAFAAARKDIEATKTEYDAKLRGMLGEQKFSELSGFEQTVGDQRSLDGIARAFDRKETPLQPEQREALANIMREERLKNPSNEIPDLGGGPGMSLLLSESEAKVKQQQEEEYQSRVLGRASQAGLSPDQVTVLQGSFKEQNQRRVMGRVMGRAFLGGGK